MQDLSGATRPNSGSWPTTIRKEVTLVMELIFRLIAAIASLFGAGHLTV
jgi:hypothetical protein